MKNRLQVFDIMQIFVGLFLGLGAKIFENITNGDISLIFSIINLFALLFFVQGIINSIEDKYDVKLLKLTNINYSK